MGSTKRVTFAATVGMAMTIPGQTAGLSIFIDAFLGDLGLSRSAISIIGPVVLALGLDVAGDYTITLLLLALLPLALGMASLVYRGKR
ncbi:MAG TPA: hypothetical protein VMO47_08700 [Rhodothermales bacterium]|nr:hypothetical protein [Rhodothermales bacterium]